MSPAQQLRQTLGLSLSDMALCTNVPYNQWYQYETGRSALPRKAREALRGMGHDPEELDRRQEDWKLQKADALRQSLQAR